MPISTFDGYVAANKQRIAMAKTAARTTIAAQPFSVFELAGNPGAGVLAGASTTTGVVPTDATAGCPNVVFSTGSGYLTRVMYRSTVTSFIVIYDLLWKAGAYAHNVSTSGNTPASFLSRIPGGTENDTSGCTEIWVEQVTAGTGNQAVNVTYTNNAGTTGRTTGAVGIGAAPTVGRMWQLPLQAGDKGVSGITGVVGTVASAGTFNVLVLRPLWSGRVAVANDGGLNGIDLTGMPEVYPDSALYLQIYADSTSSGVPYLNVEIAND